MVGNPFKIQYMYNVLRVGMSEASPANIEINIPAQCIMHYYVLEYRGSGPTVRDVSTKS